MKALRKPIVHIGIIYFALVNCVIGGREFFNPIVDQTLEYNISQSINTTADPCEDFYEYSCGNFRGYVTKTAENIGEITQYLNLKFNAKLIEMLKSTIRVSADSSSSSSSESSASESDAEGQTVWEKARLYYEVCVKENQRNFVKYFEELPIKWPLQIKANETHAYGKKDFWQILAQLQAYHWNDVLITQQITVDVKGTLSIILEPAVYSDLPNVKTIEAVLKNLEVNNTLEVMQQLKDSKEKWLQIFQNISSSGATTDTEMSFESMARQYPFLGVYLQELLKRKVNKINKIVLKNMEFFNYFHEIQWPSEEWQQQLNYLMLHFIFYLFEDSTDQFNDRACIQDLRNKFDLAINYMYYEAMLSHNYWLYKKSLSHISHQMKAIMQDLLEENNLNFTGPQIKALRNRLQNMKFNFGNLPSPLRRQKIEEFYKQLPELDNGNYFRNHLLLLQQRFLKSLLYQEDLGFYITSDNSLASSSSLFYVPQQNLVVIPFSSLQYPLYDYSFSPLYQVSLMGFLMSHEMAHAFDSNALMVANHSGILQTPLYVQSLECLQKQKPTEDIDERIADLLAERVAYLSFKNYHNADNDTNWSRDFYLSMAQFFCNKGELVFLDHDADSVRLNQIVKNSKGFAEAFNCPLDSGMNPQNKCRLF